MFWSGRRPLLFQNSNSASAAVGDVQKSGNGIYALTRLTIDAINSAIASKLSPAITGKYKGACISVTVAISSGSIGNLDLSLSLLVEAWLLDSAGI